MVNISKSSITNARVTLAQWVNSYCRDSQRCHHMYIYFSSNWWKDLAIILELNEFYICYWDIVKAVFIQTFFGKASSKWFSIFGTSRECSDEYCMMWTLKALLEQALTCSWISVPIYKGYLRQKSLLNLELNHHICLFYTNMFPMFNSHVTIFRLQIKLVFVDFVKQMWRHHQIKFKVPSVLRSNSGLLQLNCQWKDRKSLHNKSEALTFRKVSDPGSLIPGEG